MRYEKFVWMAVLLCSLPGIAGDKQKGTTVLKDLQPAGTTDKNNKTQKFDFEFEASGMHYMCRTSDKMKATDWPVGSNISYQIDNDKVKIKNTRGKGAECKVVRVETVKPSASN